jgi:hypothetical protein
MAARDSGLYFLIRNPMQAESSTVLHTGPEGEVLNWTPLSGERVTDMAVDSQGSQSILSGDRTLLTYDPHGVQTRSVTLDAPAGTLVLVHGEPWGIRPDYSLEPLIPGAARAPRFRVISRSPDLALYSVRDGAVALVDGDVVRILDLDGRNASVTMNPAQWITAHPGLRLRSIAAAEERTMFILGTTRQSGTAWILQTDQTGHPLRSLRIALPEDASPTLIAATAERLYLADPQGHVWYADTPSSSVPIEQRLDSSAILISSMEPFRQSLRKAGYTAGVSLAVTVDEQGRVRQLQVHQDLGTSLPQEALDQAGHWRFEPAVKGGKAIPSTVQIEVGR